MRTKAQVAPHLLIMQKPIASKENEGGYLFQISVRPKVSD